MIDKGGAGFGCAAHGRISTDGQWMVHSHRNQRNLSLLRDHPLWICPGQSTPPDLCCSIR